MNAVTQTVQLPVAAQRRGIDEAQWNTLTSSLFPGAKVDSVLMVIDYCRARKLDPMKKPCHIVPMEVRQGRDYVWRDVVMPGIYELRTTAMRTELYMGHDKPENGALIEGFGVTAPEWCEYTVYRWHPLSGTKVPYTARVFFEEVVALKDGKANSRWRRAPRQMLEKCAEAAALRKAFPDELGGEQTKEEMEGRVIDAAVIDETTGELIEEQSQRDPEEEPKPERKAPRSRSASNGNSGGNVKRCTEGQERLIGVKLSQAGIPVNEFCARYQLKEIAELPFDSVNDALHWIANPDEDMRQTEESSDRE
jgi:phage recombination protein Bet